MKTRKLTAGEIFENLLDLMFEAEWDECNGDIDKYLKKNNISKTKYKEYESKCMKTINNWKASQNRS